MLAWVAVRDDLRSRRDGFMEGRKINARVLLRTVKVDIPAREGNG